MPDRMDWARLAWTCLACLLLLVCGAAGGYLVAHVRAANKVAAAQSATAVCASAADTQQAVIAKLTQTAQANQRALDAARAVAQAAMQARDTLQRTLTAQARQHQHDIEEAAHAHAACADLLHRAVCPAVAGELFGPADGDHAAGSDHRHP